MFLFAEDLACVSTSPKGLQLMLNELKKYCTEWNLKVNEDKSKIMIFRKGRKTRKEEWQYNGNLLQNVEELKYLGLVIQNNCRWISHGKEKVEKAELISNSLIRLYYRYEEIPIKFILNIWDSLAAATLMYGIELIEDEMITKKFEVIARKFYKAILGLPRGTCGPAVNILLGRNRLEAHGKIRGLKLWHKVMTGKDERLSKQTAMDHCKWVQEKESQLNLIGARNLTLRPEECDSQKFNNFVKRRIRDIDFQSLLGELNNFSSTQYLRQLNPALCIMPELIKTNNREIRRLIALVMTNSFEKAINRINGEKFCKLCDGKLIRNIISHRALECRELRKLKENYADFETEEFSKKSDDEIKDWYIKNLNNHKSANHRICIKLLEA